MKTKPLQLILALSGLSFVCAHAQTLPEFLKSAGSQHPSVLQAKSQSESAGFDVDSARWQRYPTVSSDVRSPNNYTQNITKVEQPVWSGGRITSQIKAAEAGQRASLASIEEAQLNVMTQTVMAFFDVLRMQERLVIAEKNVKDHQLLVGLINRRVASEISPNADAVQANARLQQAIAEKIQIARALDAAKLEVMQWSGLAISEVHVPSSIDFVRDTNDDSYVSKAREASGQRRRLVAQIEAAKAQYGVASAQLYPSVVAGYQHVWAGPAPGTVPPTQFYMALQYQPGAGLSVLSNKEAAVRKQQAAEYELETLFRNLDSQVRSNLTEVDAYLLQIGPAQDLLSSASEVVESYLRQYQVGRRNWLEVLNAVREKSQAAYNLADIKFGQQQSIVKLLLLTGDITINEFSVIHD